METASDTNKRILLVDTMNFLDYFVPYIDDAGQKIDPWLVLGHMKRRVRGFLEAAALAELDPKFVVHGGRASEEAQERWTVRREKEVEDGHRNLIAGADDLLVECLRHDGAEVYLAEGQDGDDIIALLANHFGPRSLILSADRDMYRYEIPDRDRRLMERFSLNESGSQYIMVLHPSTNKGIPGKTHRSNKELKESIPWQPEVWLEASPMLSSSRLHSSRGYVRGASCSYVRKYGNVHGHLAPLRHAIYSVMDPPSRIRELYPEWDSNQDEIHWVEQTVAPCLNGIPQELELLLSDPDDLDLNFQALEWLEARDPSCHNTTGGGDPPERQWARCFLLAELIHSIPGGTRTLLQMLQDFSGQALPQTVDDDDMWPPTMYLTSGNINAICAVRGCGRPFSVGPKEQRYLKDLNYSLPTRCRACRARRAERKRQEGQA